MLRKSAVAFAVASTAALAASLFAINEKNNSPTDAKPPPAKPVPLLTPEEELKTLNLPEGWRADVVASDPMLEHPVAMAFDADGRMWVAEMPNYMPDVHGKGEKEPTGRIVILQDTDGDGRVDKRSVFLDGLVLPRAIGLVRDGALVGVPPNLHFWRDTDGDGKADTKELIAADYGVTGNVEHQPNGLVTMLDNWIYSADYNKRFRFTGGKWVADAVPDMGQWGISQDDVGRFFFNTNSDYLRGNLYGPTYALRNRHYPVGGVNVQLQANQDVWPAHATAVNRGYTKNFLRDGKLAKFTAACAPLIYRGGLFPEGWEGNAFVCEPSANVIRRSVIKQEPDGRLTAINAYEQKEFIASTYERFRPVNLYTGPDGGLCVVDMHHGLIQHTYYLTDYNAADYKQRELDKHLRTGRIFRIYPEGAKLYPKPNLSKLESKDLVPVLSHPNGWWRDTAQRLLVERGGSSTAKLLKAEVTGGKNPLGRLHALWALEGMRLLDRATAVASLSDADPRVRAAGLRVIEPWLAGVSLPVVLPAMLKLESDADPLVRLQLALAAGSAGVPETDELMLRMLTAANLGAPVRDAVVGGLYGRELEFLERCLKSWATVAETESAKGTIAALSRAVLAESKAPRVERLLEIAAEQDDAVHKWRRTAIIEAIAPVEGKASVVRKRGVILPEEPPALAKLRAVAEPALQAKLDALVKVIHWPGQAGWVAPPMPPALTSTELARFEAGRAIFGTTCGTCHKPDGMGQAGLAPPLVDSEWVLGDPLRTIRIVLHGVRGPIKVNGQEYNMEMPALKLLSDEDVASVLTYVRREWEHGASPVKPELVGQVRKETDGRQEPWTAAELVKFGVDEPGPTTNAATAPTAGGVRTSRRAGRRGT